MIKDNTNRKSGKLSDKELKQTEEAIEIWNLEKIGHLYERLGRGNYA